nr:spidroin-1-like [Anas platyrhynchos]
MGGAELPGRLPGGRGQREALQAGGAAGGGGFRALLSPERGGQRQGLRGQGDPTGSAQGSGGGGEGAAGAGAAGPCATRHFLRLHGHLATRKPPLPAAGALRPQVPG